MRRLNSFKLFEALIFIFLTFLIFSIIQDYVVFENKMIRFVKEKEKNIERIELYSNYLFNNTPYVIETTHTTVASEIFEATNSKMLKSFHVKIGNKEIELIVLENLGSM